MTPIREKARAKINLTLSVLGKRLDGYHELLSLVTFADFGDDVVFEPGAPSGVLLTGPFAADIEGDDIAAKALSLLAGAEPRLRLGAVTVAKNLPVAAGLGGGSADAAAILRAVRRANPELADTVPWQRLAAELGADVPVCLVDLPAWMSGKGDILQPREAGGEPVPALLVNPRRGLATRRVFEALDAKPLAAQVARNSHADAVRTLDDLVAVVRACGNDLQSPAEDLLPVIKDVKAAIGAQNGCRVAAMSGSGPTCFGIFDDWPAAERAARTLAAARPEWWSVATRLDRPAR